MDANTRAAMTKIGKLAAAGDVDAIPAVITARVLQRSPEDRQAFRLQIRRLLPGAILNSYLIPRFGFERSRFESANPDWETRIQRAADGGLGAVVSGMLKIAGLP